MASQKFRLPSHPIDPERSVSSFVSQPVSQAVLEAGQREARRLIISILVTLVTLIGGGLFLFGPVLRYARQVQEHPVSLETLPGKPADIQSNAVKANAMQASALQVTAFQ